MRLSNRMLACTLCGVGLAGLPDDANGQHSDIEVFNDTPRLVVEGGPVFEGQFGDAGSLFTTINPGFASEPDEAVADGFAPLPAGEQIRFNVLDALFFWDGSQTAPVPADHFLRIQQGSTPDVIRDVDGASGFQSGFVFGQEGAASDGSSEEPESGGFHAHLTFELLKDSGSGLEAGSTPGAYGVVMDLQGSSLDRSNPFGVMLNFGLDEADFEAAEESFASIVPEPTTLLLAGGGMLLVLGGRRRRVRDHV